MMTFKELKKLVKLPLYKEQRVPTVKALEESGVSVVAEKILENHGSISVYQNGYVIYRAHKRVTVFSLRNCVHYKYDALEGAGHHIEEEEFDEYEWYIRLVLEGEDRIFMNYEIIQGKWMPSREDREYREEILEGVDEAVSTLERMISEERVEELLSTLTDLQRKVVHTHLFHGLSFTEAAKHLGMTRQNLTGIYNAAIYKIQKKHFRACRTAAGNRRRTGSSLPVCRLGRHSAGVRREECGLGKGVCGISLVLLRPMHRNPRICLQNASILMKSLAARV